MPRHNWFEPGQWNFVCDICGQVYKSAELRRGFGASLDAVVCPSCQTPQQPQDFVRVFPDNQSVPVARPRVFLTAPLVIFYGYTVGELTLGDDAVIGGP